MVLLILAFGTFAWLYGVKKVADDLEQAVNQKNTKQTVLNLFYFIVLLICEMIMILATMHLAHLGKV
jgi:TRAP-type C4-dicarboxylate transport system permease large subunit